ncbi:MAG: OadG family transporter subunit [Sellimonas intestinalis]|uniref:OadG family transporter subunit n=1 Tax=Sellimonas intestinalis TaxID=1653434 RepID=UPI0039A21A3E
MNHPEPEETEASEETAEDLTDDLELAAVITAAIAASEGTSTDGFVVRSIKKRRKNSQWK